MRVISRGGYRRAGRGPKPGCRCRWVKTKVFKFFPYTFPQLFKLFSHRAVNDTFSTPSLPPCPVVFFFFSLPLARKREQTQQKKNCMCGEEILICCVVFGHFVEENL